MRDIVEGPPRFDGLVVLLRRAYIDMAKGHACSGQLEFISPQVSLKVPLSKGYEARETWVRNQLLEIIKKATAGDIL